MEIEEALRAHGRRVTQPRRVVWEVLRRAEGHLSAQQIADQVDAIAPSVNRSSVYRAIGLLDELGLVRESRLAGAEHPASTWEISHGDGVIHLVCEGCGEVQHWDTGTVGEKAVDQADADLIDHLRSTLRASASFHPTTIDIRVSGHCEACAEP